MPPMATVLWPYLLELFTRSEYTEALGIMCKCLSYIAGKMRKEQDSSYLIDFDKHVNLPKPHAILARLLVILNEPLGRSQRGEHIIKCLQAIGPVLHPSISNMWDSALPKLALWLQKNEENFNSDVWEDLVLRLLSETIKIVNDNEWTVGLGRQYVEQISLYSDSHNLKKCILKHLGLVLQRTTHKQFIQESLSVIFSVTDHKNAQQKLGCAQSFGYCATSHLDSTLENLNERLNSKPQKKGGFLSNLFNKDSSGSLDEKNTMYLCYGYVAAYAPVHLITSRIDVHILSPTKDKMIAAISGSEEERVSLLKMIDLIGKAMHPSHLKTPFTFLQRDQLIKNVLHFIGGQVTEAQDPKNKKKPNVTSKATNKLRILALDCLSTLIRLEPNLPPELESDVLITVKNFFDLLADKKEQKEAEKENKKMNELFVKLNQLYTSFLFMNTSIAQLSRILESFCELAGSKLEHHRHRSVDSILSVLQNYIECKLSDSNLEKGPKETEKKFSQLGKYLGVVIPRCCDPNNSVRKNAMESIQNLLYVDFIIKKEAQSFDSLKGIEQPDELLALLDLKDRVDTIIITEQFKLVHEMSVVLSKIVLKEELTDLILVSLGGLNDVEENCARGVCVYLNAMTKLRGEELKDFLEPLISGIMSALSKIDNEKTIVGTLAAIKNLATHHLTSTIDEILKIAPPHPDYVKKSLQIIAKDSDLITPLLKHFTHLLNNTTLYTEEKGGVLVCSSKAASATSAFGEIFEPPEMDSVIKKYYAVIFCTFMLRFGTSVGNKVPEGSKNALEPIEQAIQAFKIFLQCNKEEYCIEKMNESGWDILKDKERYYEGITTISMCIAKDHPEYMESIYKYLLMYMQGNFPGQRVIAATIYAEFINHAKPSKESNLIDLLLNSLLKGLADPTIKIMCLRGLGNIVSAGVEDVNKYATTILDALLTSIDDQNEILAMEAMNGLAKVFELVDEERVAPVLVNICNRIRPAFSKKNPEIRSSAFNLFGTLWHFGKERAKDVFYEQIHSNLPLLILHTNDEDKKVVKSCKRALRNLGPLFRVEEINELFQSENFDEERYLKYSMFLDEICKMLVKSYPEKMNYLVMSCVKEFKSEWELIRANAASFVGYLLGHLPLERRQDSNLNPGLVANALINLLSDSSAIVREKASESISLLYSY